LGCKKVEKRKLLYLHVDGGQEKKTNEDLRKRKVCGQAKLQRNLQGHCDWAVILRKDLIDCNIEKVKCALLC
jgi:hypothetical protein